jgi:hypothetical protein
MSSSDEEDQYHGYSSDDDINRILELDKPLTYPAQDDLLAAAKKTNDRNYATNIQNAINELKDAERESKFKLSVDTATDDSGRTALMWAIGRGNSAAVGLLLENNANPFTRDNMGNNAMDYANKIKDAGLVDDDIVNDIITKLERSKGAWQRRRSSGHTRTRVMVLI